MVRGVGTFRKHNFEFNIRELRQGVKEVGTKIEKYLKVTIGVVEKCLDILLKVDHVSVNKIICKM